MAGPSLQTEAFVLHRRPPTESFQGFTVFSAEHGTLQTLQRIGGKNAAPLDLFDAVALVLESSNQGRTWFIRESRLIARHTGIGRNYEGLRLASELASLVTRNAVPEESRRAVADLLRGAFGAFETGVRPDIVFFKSLYRFARDEGYPLKQHWFPSLPAEDRQDVAALLNLPLAEQSAPAPSVLRLQRRLEDYLRGHTEILLD